MKNRDCENCIHRVPILDKVEGIWRGADFCPKEDMRGNDND